MLNYPAPLSVQDGADIAKSFFEHLDSVFPALPQSFQKRLMRYARPSGARPAQVNSLMERLVLSAPEDLRTRLYQLPFSPLTAAPILFSIWSMPKSTEEWGPHAQGPSLAARWRPSIGSVATLSECVTLLNLCLTALGQKEEAFPEQTGLAYNSLFNETKSTKIDWSISKAAPPETFALQLGTWLESSAAAAQKALAMGNDVDMQYHWAVSARNALLGQSPSPLLEADIAPAYKTRALSELQACQEAAKVPLSALAPNENTPSSTA